MVETGTGGGAAAGDVLALVPARGGSRGLPRKNLLPLAGRPLLWHSVRCAELVRGVARTVVTTDDPEIAAAARDAGAVVPALRPADLAGDATPMAAVVAHAVTRLVPGPVEPFVLLLDPTSPVRDPDLVAAAVQQLRDDPEAVGVVSVSQPTFRPSWVGVRLDGGRLRRWSEQGRGVTRRQDAEPFWRINGNFYVWRADFAAGLRDSWFDEGPHRGFEVPERLGFSIDDRFEFDVVAALVAQGVVGLPWLTTT